MRLRQQPGAPDLKPETVAVLLLGWGAPDPPEPSEPGFGGGFLDLLEPGGAARLWRQHEAFLRETARRWGWEPTYKAPDGRMLYEAEAVAEGWYDA